MSRLPTPFPVGAIREAPVHLVRAGSGKVEAFGRNAASAAEVGAAWLSAITEMADGDTLQLFSDANIGVASTISADGKKWVFEFAPGVRISKTSGFGNWKCGDDGELYLRGGIFDHCLWPHPSDNGGLIVAEGCEFLVTDNSGDGWFHNESGSPATECYLLGCTLRNLGTGNQPFELEVGESLHIDAATKIIGTVSLTFAGTEAVDWMPIFGRAITATGIAAIGAANAAALRNAAGASAGVFPVTAGGTGGSTATAARTALGVGHVVAAYSAGSDAQLNEPDGVFIAVDFGTTDPVVVLDQPGRWKLTAVVAATVGNVGESISLKLRRTNNTAGDLANSQTVPITFETPGDTKVILLPPVIYETANSTDSITIFGASSEESGVVSDACLIAELIR